uniref:Ulp1 protease family, C-terminal catalytic domain-containing protein n=1 Tax=Tanacetum cinerariifolium TaxID=118510 RepID=A0A699H2V0_TANCI|nr:hypothetical protein [Tanacetum cinerariifolium]
MGKENLESDYPRDFNDEFLIAFKKQFEDKKYPTTTGLSRLIQRTTNINFMFQINYLMLFANCMINCDNTSRLKYHVIKNIRSSDIISDFDWCSFIWDHIKTSKVGWNDMTLQNWYYGPDTVLMLIYETIEAKFESVLTEKRELEDMLKEIIEMHELFYEDEKFELFVKKFKKEFTTCLNRDENKAGISGTRHGNDNDDVDYNGHCNDEDDVGHANHEDVHANEEKEANEATKKKEEAENLAAEKKEKAEKLAIAKKKEAAEKSSCKKAKREKIEAAKKNKQAAQKEKNEKAKKEAKDAEEKKQSPSKKKKINKSEPTAEKGADVSKATTVPKSFKSPKVQQKMFEKGQESTEKPKGKRITKSSVYLKSPNMNTMVKTQDKIDEDEFLCARSVFCMQGDINEVVFNDGKGTIAQRKEMQSLAPGIEIEKQIIDTLVTVLNYEERIRTDGKDFRKRYFPTDAVNKYKQLLNEDKDQAKKYQSFENVIKNQMNASESKKNMKDVKPAFFLTVVSASQYYVIVFNLLKANAIILVNEKHDNYKKYKEVFDLVKVLFLKYLQKHQHPCVEKLSKDKPAKVLKMKSKTEKNKIDSGLYMMMHMELYQGESASNWKTNIIQENNRDYEMQMTSMRMRYTTKILMHEMNTKRGLMSGYAKKFPEDNKD